MLGKFGSCLAIIPESYDSLKRKSGLKDKELGAALGWLAREDKIEIHQEEDELYVSLGVNVYIG